MSCMPIEVTSFFIEGSGSEHNMYVLVKPLLVPALKNTCRVKNDLQRIQRRVFRTTIRKTGFCHGHLPAFTSMICPARY